MNSRKHTKLINPQHPIKAKVQERQQRTGGAKHMFNARSQVTLAHLPKPFPHYELIVWKGNTILHEDERWYTDLEEAKQVANQWSDTVIVTDWCKQAALDAPGE